MKENLLSMCNGMYIKWLSSMFYNLTFYMYLRIFFACLALYFQDQTLSANSSHLNF